MPVAVATRHMEVTDKRLWQVIFHYVNKARGKLDLQDLKAFALDETKSRRRHKYVTIFIDLDRTECDSAFYQSS